MSIWKLSGRGEKQAKQNENEQNYLEIVHYNIKGLGTWNTMLPKWKQGNLCWKPPMD